MNRLVLLAPILFLLSASLLAAQDDKITKELDDERSIYEASIDRAEQDLRNLLTEQRDKSQKSGNLERLELIDREIAAFDESKTMPTSVKTNKYTTAINSSKAKLTSALARAKDRYTKDGQIELAKLIKQELDDLNKPPQAKPSHFQPDSKWVGESIRIAANSAPEKFTFELTVLSRKDNEFTARVNIGGIVIFTLTGKVENDQISWSGNDIKHEKGIARHDYKGKVVGSRLSLEYGGFVAKNMKTPVLGKVEANMIQDSSKQK